MRVRVTDAAVGFQFGMRISSTAASGAAALHDETHELNRIGAFVEGRHAVSDRDPAALLLPPDMPERSEPRRVAARAGPAETHRGIDVLCIPPAAATLQWKRGVEGKGMA